MKKLVALANEFYLESNFEKIFENLAKARQEVISRMEAAMMSDKEISNLEDFYGQAFDQYLVVPSLTIWSGPGWGFPTQATDSRNANFILGPLSKNYDFSDTDIRQLSQREIILTTEKDYMRLQPKLDKFALYYLPINTIILKDQQPYFEARIRDAVKEMLKSAD